MIYGRLTKTRKGGYVFKPDRKHAWQPVESSHSFAEWRLQCKRQVGRYLKQRFGQTPCSALFTSLATGDIDERTLAIEFGRLGLSHILAISGFHFALFAAFLLFCIGLALPFRSTQIVVLCLICAYLFFLGPSPSAMRAFCAIALALTGKITGLRSSGINALGAGLAVILLFDPPFCQNLGFQLSVLCTAALLLLYGPCEKILELLFIKRTTSDVKTMPILDQNGALLAALLRKALALTLAVHIVTLPVCLFHFSVFPLLGSLLYNLFFPFLLSLSLFLLLTGCIIGAVFPWAGQLLHTLNREFTNFLLHSVTHAPAAIKGVISTGPISPLVISLWLSALLAFAILTNANRKMQNANL
jgi:competence protein ComEC